MYFSEICDCEIEINILRMEAMVMAILCRDREECVGEWYGQGCRPGLKKRLIEILKRRDIFSEAYPTCCVGLWEALTSRHGGGL